MRARDRVTARTVWAAMLLVIGLSATATAQEAPAIVLAVEPALSAAAAVRHAARFEGSEACVVARINGAGGPAPSGATALGGQLVPGLDRLGDEPVTEVEGRVLAVESRLTADGTRVFTVYRLAVDAVLTADARVPVEAGQAIVVSRPGGRVPLGGQTVVAVVAGFGIVEVGMRWRPLLVAADGGEGYHEVRRPMPGGGGGAR